MTRKAPAPPAAEHDAPAPHARRMTLSDVVAALLNRSPSSGSSVTLARNAKGDTQIEVVVRTGDTGDVLTPDDAYAKAAELYNAACAAYPPPAPAAPAAKS